MAGTEVTIAVAAALFAAFCLGFLGHWIIMRASSGQRDTVDGHTTSEAKLRARLAETEAELTAALDGLHQARQDNEALRAELGRPGPVAR